MKNIFYLLLLLLVARPTEAATFKKTKLILGKTSLTIEVADDDDKREQGLMHRPALSDEEGMIFIFDSAEPQNFWMKNTVIPLSIGFFDSKGKLFKILDMQPASPMDLNPKTYPSVDPAKYALEEPLGWFKRKKISTGVKLSLPDLKLP